MNLLSKETTRPEYQVRFHGSPNATTMWDNQATAHAGPIDYAHFDLPSMVRRITVAGDVALSSDGFYSRPLDGDLLDVIGEYSPNSAGAVITQEKEFSLCSTLCLLLWLWGAAASPCQIAL